MPTQYRGRFAPSPTGPLHFGSLLCAVASYLDARQHHGTWLVRIEDVDATRCKRHYTDQILTTLESYGLVSDEPVRLQLEHSTTFEHYLGQLKQQQRVFPCNCTRQSLSQYQGRHPHICPSTEDTPHSWRLKTDNDAYQIDDGIQGTLTFSDDLTGNHPILKRKDGYFSYQLAVVVDDHLQGITHLVRGADLIDTTAQQLFLYDLFGWQAPKMSHIPLIVNAQQEKVSKQNHAKAIQDGDLATLKRALFYLGVPSSNTHTIDDTLAQAVALWSPAALTSQQTLELVEQDNQLV